MKKGGKNEKSLREAQGRRRVERSPLLACFRRGAGRPGAVTPRRSYPRREEAAFFFPFLAADAGAVGLLVEVDFFGEEESFFFFSPRFFSDSIPFLRLSLG